MGRLFLIPFTLLTKRLGEVEPKNIFSYKIGANNELPAHVAYIFWFFDKDYTTNHISIFDDCLHVKDVPDQELGSVNKKWAVANFFTKFIKNKVI